MNDMCLIREAFSWYLPRHRGSLNSSLSTLVMPLHSGTSSNLRYCSATISSMHHHHRVPSLSPVLWVPPSLDDLERHPPHHQCRCTHSLPACRGSHRTHLCKWCLLTTARCIVPHVEVAPSIFNSTVGYPSEQQPLSTSHSS